ncbi:MAG: hypothetical protein V7688_12645 [Alcanivorax jadensis]|uniref:hypothetical protein n=1 Tax=Alcanivorax jadensis TaxID=64988 RepID=UPI0030039787
MSDSVREAFENWWRSRPSYRDSDKEAAFVSWQAALSANGGEVVGWLVSRKGDRTFPRFYFDKSLAKGCVEEVELLPFATMSPVYTHLAPPSVAVPEGWKLVPIEPTALMMDAVCHAYGGDDDWLFHNGHDVILCHRAMVNAAPSPDHIADAGKVDEDRRCSHGIRHPHPCRECEDAPLSIAEAGKVAPVSIPDSEFDETNPIHQAADAYSYACEIMEQHQSERVAAGKDPGTIGSLCDGIAWLYEYIQELEAATPSVPENEEIKRALVWAMNNMNLHTRAHNFARFVLDRGGNGDFGDCIEFFRAYARLRTAGDEGEE